MMKLLNDGDALLLLYAFIAATVIIIIQTIWGGG